jgi:hypothetical protein
MTFVAPEVRTAQIPSGASISQNSDDAAWGTETGSTSEAEIAMFEIISTIQRTSKHLNRVDLKRLQRKLLMGAANRDALSTFALRALKPILDNIPDDLQVCPKCHQGVNPGVQICDCCKHVLSTIQSKVEETVKGSLVALVTDATVACVDNEDEPVEEVDRQRQPRDMSGNVPTRSPIAGANPGVLGITYLAQTGHEDYTQVNEPAPLNPGRVAEGGTFAFLGRRKKKVKALKDETPEDKEARLTQKKFDEALKEVSKNVRKDHGGPANQFIRKVKGEGGPNYPILHDHVTRTRTFMDPQELDKQHKVIREYEKCLMREAWAFDEWKRRLYEKVEKGDLPRSVEPLIETYNILDMFDDMKAHAMRKATASKSGEFCM